MSLVLEGMTTTRPIAPTLNLNGSGADHLLATLEAALSALHAADAAVAECAPHGRDYPNQEEFPEARAQHRARQEALGGILKELASVYESVQEQQNARQRARGGHR